MQGAVRLHQFVTKIWRWYAKNKRSLPWRDLAIPDDNQRAYMILVSEVMLQQTQVSRVQVLFPRFLQYFPTIHDLARASNREVLIAWRGMGYNSRALRLRDAARMIGERGFPRSMEELQQIPGIGPYTAAAIRNFAFDMPTPCVDVNIERILTRVFVVKGKKKVGEKAGNVLRIALEAPHPNPLPRGEGISTAHWHSALMDFGSAVCTKRSPKCAQCPLSQGICRSAFKVLVLSAENSQLKVRSSKLREPGRVIAGRFIPNRIVRGKIVDLLRDHPRGLTFEAIGRNSCLAWSKEQRSCLRKILGGLCRDSLLRNTRGKYAIS